MVPIAYFGINSSALTLVVDLLIVFLAVIYFALIYWTYNDARRRIADPMLVFCATIAACFPFVGPITYMILRPPEYLDDAHERELETRVAQARVAELEASLCPHCDYPVQRDFMRCPSCLQRLKEPCGSCSKPLDPAWSICPYCEAEVPGAVPPSRAQRRRRRTSEREESLVGGDGRRAATATAAAEDIFGETMESDSLALSAEEDEQEVEPVSAPSRESRPRRSSSRRSRPSSR